MSKLYVVPTPIGNLDDITLRAVRVLSDVDLILAEDTRTTQVLLRHLGIEKRMWSHHKFNEHAAVRPLPVPSSRARRSRWCRMPARRVFPIPVFCS